LTGIGLEAIHTTIIVFLIPPHRTQQLYGIEFSIYSAQDCGTQPASHPQEAAQVLEEFPHLIE
jgi:hypothetical protein